jgi:hypothetical protein
MKVKKFNEFEKITENTKKRTIKQIKKQIETSKDFNTYFSYTGEDYDSALELWIEKNHDIVDVWSPEDATKLINDINALND